MINSKKEKKQVIEHKEYEFKEDAKISDEEVIRIDINTAKQ